MSNRVCNVVLTSIKNIPGILSPGNSYTALHLECREKNDKMFYWITGDDGIGRWLSEDNFANNPRNGDLYKNPDNRVDMPLELPLPLIKELAAQRIVQILEEIVKNDPHGNMEK